MLMAYTNSEDPELIARKASAQSDCGLLCSSVYYIVPIDYVIGNASLFVGIVDSRYLEFLGTLLNTSTYPYLDI